MGALEALTLGGALEGAVEARAQHSAFEGLAMEGALEAQAQLSAFDGLALERA